MASSLVRFVYIFYKILYFFQISRRQTSFSCSLSNFCLPFLMYVFSLPPFAADLYIPEDRIAIEVDGPHHYTRNSLRPMGEMFTRDLLLEARNYKVVSVPFFAWGGVEEDGRRAFLQNLLTKAKAGDTQNPAKELGQVRGRRGPAAEKAGKEGVNGGGVESLVEEGRQGHGGEEGNKVTVGEGEDKSGACAVASNAMAVLPMQKPQ